MAISNAQKLAKAKYQREKRTLIAAEVSKDKGNFYRTSATELNLSLSKLIQNAVEEFIARRSTENLSLVDQAAISTPAQQPEKLSTAEKNLLAEFNKLPVETQKLFLKLIQNFNAQNSKGGD